MTKFIYRGVAHDGTKEVERAIPQDLVYRGVQHDGLAASPAAPTRDMPMRYRGVAYTIPAVTQAADLLDPASDEMEIPYKLAV